MNAPQPPASKLVAADRVRVEERSVHLGVPPLGGCADPNVEVVTKDGVISAIEITCSCGQQMRLVCEYS